LFRGKFIVSPNNGSGKEQSSTNFTNLHKKEIRVIKEKSKKINLLTPYKNLLLLLQNQKLKNKKLKI
jgi:hypothetical protein